MDSPTDVLSTVSSSFRDRNRRDIQLAAARAMKFQRARAEAAAEAAAEASKAMAEAGEEEKKEGEAEEPKPFSVAPAAEDGVEIQPAPGQDDPAVRVRAQDDFMSPVTTTTDFMGAHSYQEDIKALLQEVDMSENKIKGLKLRVVEKQNFLASLEKREELLTSDVDKDQQAVKNLQSHVQALKARAARLRKEKELRMLESQFHEYSAAASKLKAQAEELARVKDALYSKMRNLHNDIKPLRATEAEGMRASINADGASAGAAPAEVPSADAASDAASDASDADAAAAPAADAAVGDDAASAETPAADASAGAADTEESTAE